MYIARAVLLAAILTAPLLAEINTLTTDEKRAGWELLFDGRSLSGWTGSDGLQKPDGWRIESGALVTVPGVTTASDLVSDGRYEDFELRFQFRLSQGANTGVKYFVNHALRYLSNMAKSSSASGVEFQLADDRAPETSGPDSRTGALYGILPVEHPAPPVIGQWTTGRLICRRMACEHWIGQTRVLQFDLKQMKQPLTEAALNTQHSLSSSLAAITALRLVGRGRAGGRISLQYHETQVWFRDLKIQRLLN